MLKHLIIIFSLLQIVHCLSGRSNIWWSRRNEDSHIDCDLSFDNENPSLEGKVCGYCFAKCQQQFAACLLAQMNQVVNNSIDYCSNLSRTCETSCLNDKRTSRVAEVNWTKVVQFLQQYNSFSANEEEKNH